ncbi:MAG: DUF1127 domain-containing protein [Rhodobacteraceae bacterium]|nr:DUF1127 domain-containing protein [Paracoccaceae bacterium]
MTQTTPPLTSDLRYLTDHRPLAPITASVLRLAVLLDKWSTRRRTRRALSQLEPHLLNDIGLDLETARQEAQRAFWLG